MEQSMTLNRAQTTERLLSTLATCLREDQYDNISRFFHSLSMEEFWATIAYLKARYGNSTMTLKDIYNNGIDRMKLSGVSCDNAATSRLKADVLTESENAELLKRLDAQKPSDAIRLNHAGDMKLIHLWEDNITDAKGDRRKTIPSDLFFAETIPLMDCQITVDERKAFPDGKLVSYRVAVFHDYANALHAASYDETVPVGVVVLGDGSRQLLLPFDVVKGVDGLLMGSLGYRNNTREQIVKGTNNAGLNEILNMGASLLETWYGLQIALLHPVVRTIFTNSRKVAVIGSTDAQGKPGKPRKSTKRKRKVMYIKEYIINAAELDEAMFGKADANQSDAPNPDAPEPRQQKRHALIWYVIGHWRSYADGRRIFIKPYWKGELRELKMSSEAREREIAQVHPIPADSTDHADTTTTTSTSTSSLSSKGR